MTSCFGSYVLSAKTEPILRLPDEHDQYRILVEPFLFWMIRNVFSVTAPRIVIHVVRQPVAGWILVDILDELEEVGIWFNQ